MRATSIVLLAILALASLSSCVRRVDTAAEEVAKTPIIVQAEGKTAADFGTYTSWSWIPEPIKDSGRAMIDNKDWRKLVDKAVEKEMSARGYVRDTENPSLLVNAVAAIKQIDREYIEKQYGGYYYPEYHAQNPDTSGRLQTGWEEGTLVLFVFDAATKQVVWSGNAKTEVYEWVSEPARENRTREAIHLLLKDMPARAK